MENVMEIEDFMRICCQVSKLREKTSQFSSIIIWVFPKIGVPQNGWFRMENPIKMDDLGVYPYFWKHPYV